MCEFCEFIKSYWEDKFMNDDCCYHDIHEDMARENPNIGNRGGADTIKLIRHNGEFKFYGFNKYPYKNNALYENVEINYCPVCGRKLSEGEEIENEV